MEINALQREVFQTAVEHGWWPMASGGIGPDDVGFTYKDGPQVNLGVVSIPEKLCLMHEEISEALGHYRNGTVDTFLDTANGEKPDGLWIELADCIIRILDLAGAYDIDMEYMLRIKADYNKTRPYRHGNKHA